MVGSQLDCRGRYVQPLLCLALMAHHGWVLSCFLAGLYLVQFVLLL
jgi:hypothetical protein